MGGLLFALSCRETAPRDGRRASLEAGRRPLQGPHSFRRKVQPRFVKRLVAQSHDRKVRIIDRPYFVLARNIDRVAIIDTWKPIGLRDVRPIPKAGLSLLRQANQSGMFE